MRISTVCKVVDLCVFVTSCRSPKKDSLDFNSDRILLPTISLAHLTLTMTYNFWLRFFLPTFQIVPNQCTFCRYSLLQPRYFWTVRHHWWKSDCLNRPLAIIHEYASILFIHLGKILINLSNHLISILIDCRFSYVWREWPSCLTTNSVWSRHICHLTMLKPVQLTITYGKSKGCRFFYINQYHLKLERNEHTERYPSLVWSLHPIHSKHSS